MNLTEMINEANLNKAAINVVRQQFIALVKKYNPTGDLAVNDSNSLNNFSNEETRNQFDLFVAGVILNQSAFAAGSFSIIAGDVHDAIDRWDEENLGMANELLFDINDLYIKHFGVGFMTIVEKQAKPKTNIFSDVN